MEINPESKTNNNQQPEAKQDLLLTTTTKARCQKCHSLPKRWAPALSLARGARNAFADELQKKY